MNRNIDWRSPSVLLTSSFFSFWMICCASARAFLSRLFSPTTVNNTRKDSILKLLKAYCCTRIRTSTLIWSFSNVQLYLIPASLQLPMLSFPLRSFFSSPFQFQNQKIKIITLTISYFWAIHCWARAQHPERFYHTLAFVFLWRRRLGHSRNDA